MIVQPNWLDHWKTLALVEMTGDASSPLSVLRLWSHCQSSRRWEFPGMTPAQLASVCRWGVRKPACHVALVKAGFLEKLPGGGFAVHQWNEHNASLVQKWTARQTGEQRKQAEKANDSTKAGASNEDRAKPADAPDETRPDEIGIDQKREGLKRLNDERASALESAPPDLKPNRSSLNRSQENALMERLAAFLGPDEMAYSGGHWRLNHVQKHPELLTRALDDLESQVREGNEAKATRGAWLTDLLKRWKGKG